MKRIKLFVAVIMISLGITYCGSGSNISRESAKKLKTYNSYAFLPNKDTIHNRDYNNQEINEVIIETINENLEDEDYYLDKRQPDVLIYVHNMFDDKIDIDADPVYTSYSYYRPGHYVGPYYESYTYENYFTIQRLNGDNIQQIPYKKGTIVIDFIDRRDNSILWRGTSDEEIGTRRMERDIRRYIDDIFKKFP